MSQLGRYPAALGTVALLMALFAIVPGLPFLPFLAGALLLGGAALLVTLAIRQRARDSASAEAPPEAPAARPMGDVLDLDDIHIEFAPDLVGMVLDPATGLDARIGNIRTHVATGFGLILPEIRLTDDPTLPAGGYRIRIQGVEHARDRLRPDHVLVLLPEGPSEAPEGEDVREPVFGAPARWIEADRRETAALAGLTVVTPTEVLATHLLETMKTNLGRLLSLRGLRRLLDEFANVSDPARAEANRRLVDEIVPDKVGPDLLLAVLRLLLEERVSIRNLPLILEAAAEMRGAGLSPEGVCEHVRRRLGFQLVAELRRPDGTIPLIQLAPEWEAIFAQYAIEGERGMQDVALPPEAFNRLATAIGEKVARAGEAGTSPAVVTSGLRRRFLRTVMGARGIGTPVLAYEEIGTDARPALVGLVAA
jgi:flagellar biosynthesis protein FlhA